jgi:hypothetical protein
MSGSPNQQPNAAEDRRRYLQVMTNGQAVFRSAVDDVFRVAQAVMLAQQQCASALLAGDHRRAEQAANTQLNAGMIFARKVADAEAALANMLDRSLHCHTAPEQIGAMALDVSARIKERLEEYSHPPHNAPKEAQP